VQILFENYLTRGFWGDEAWTALISSFPVVDILRITAEDFHPPFYYFLVHGFMGVFGESEWIRLISVFFYLLTPVVVFYLARKMVSKRVAVMASFLTLASPILFTYAFEARAYALLAFLSALTSLVFWRGVVDKKWKWWLVYLGLGAMGVYTHYYMWFILAGHGFYWLLFNRKQFWRVALAFGGILLVQLPWLPSLFSQVSSVAGDYWIAPINERTHWEFFARVTGGDESFPQQMFTAVMVLVLLLSSVLAMKIKEKNIV